MTYNLKKVPFLIDIYKIRYLQILINSKYFVDDLKTKVYHKNRKKLDSTYTLKAFSYYCFLITTYIL